MISELRYGRAREEISVGVDVLNGRITNMFSILDPLAVRVLAVRSAFEMNITILRIDEYTVPRKLPKPSSTS